jgi:hypothetical protein
VGTGGTAARPAIGSEVYPTRIRARGAALLGAVPVALAALAVERLGIEMRWRGIEEITAVELRKGLEAR